MSPGVDRLLGYRKAMTAANIADPGLARIGDPGREPRSPGPETQLVLRDST
jgi:hypothetical protein